ncbi:MAG: ABC transporter permease [Eubacteriales bacterium]|nr:ABC transporter permease [Eubacteriales bacterium]
MNVVKRAVFYIIRKWKKSFLIFSILFAASVLVLSGLAISDAQEEQTEELRGTTGVSFTVSRNTATGGWSSGAGGSYSTQEFLSDKMLESIGSIDGVKGYNASVRTILCLSDMDGRWLEQMLPKGYPMVDCQFYSYGCINSEYNSLFLSGALVMCEGTTITPEKDNGIVISREIAHKYGFKAGDTLQAVNNPLSDDKTLTLEITGIFDIAADKTDEKNNYNEASYYDYANYAFVSEAAMKDLLENYADVGYASADFFVSDPGQLDAVIQEAQRMDSVNWNNFVVTANDEVYERVESAVSDMGTLLSTLIVLITAVSAAVVVLILSMWMRSRTKEIGILLSVGIPKVFILLQYVLETLFIAVVSFPLSYFFAGRAAGSLGRIFGKTTAVILVTPQHFMTAAIAGTVLLVFSTLLSCIPVMRYRPIEILSQME